MAYAVHLVQRIDSIGKAKRLSGSYSGRRRVERTDSNIKSIIMTSTVALTGKRVSHS